MPTAPIRGVAEAHATLDSTVQVRPSSALPADGADRSVRGSTAAQDQLLEDVVAALRANLARGFLETEERIRGIAEALNDVVMLSDASTGQVLFVNAAYEQIWRRPRADLYANPLALLDGVHPEDRERVRQTLVGEQRLDFDLEFRVVRSSTDERYMWARGFPIRGAGGQVDRIASITADITERKLIAKSHERLIRGFTHDVKNPLGAAEGYLTLLGEGVFGPMSDAQVKGIKHARRSIRTALNLVSGLLEIEHAEAGQLTIERQRVDLTAMVADIVDEFHAAAASRSLDLAPAFGQGVESLVVESDAARVRQILANLVSNAVKYTQPGGRISVEARAAGADEGPWAGRWAAVTVTDNGPGIPSEKHSLVFREFTRFNPSAASGSGIGLAICRKLARALGGDITFTSKPDAGSTFTLWLSLDRVSAQTE